MYLDKGYQLGMLQMKRFKNTTLYKYVYKIEQYSSDLQCLKRSFSR